MGAPTLAKAMDALQAALAEPEQEMPSDTRYTVAVEGQAPTYWDCMHDAMTNAQRAVYSGVDNTTRAIDDLKAGRIAEWSYGFSAVRIYPPQSKAPATPQPEPRNQCGETCERAKLCAACAKALAEPEQHDTDCHAQGICQRSGYSLSAPPKPEQEPVAWLDEEINCAYTPEELDGGTADGLIPLYTAPTPRKPQYDKTEMNRFVQDLFDQKMREGKHGHYETLFHVVHKAIERAAAEIGKSMK